MTPRPNASAERAPVLGSLFTGLQRSDWLASADSMLLALRPYASPDRAGYRLPGRTSRYGEDSDSLETFARTFLIAAFRLHGEDGRDPRGFAQWYADGLAAGVDPTNPRRWPRPDELDQAKVEAASIALGLHLTRRWIWDRLPDRTKAHTIAWLETVVGADYPPINWVWFQIVVETFLRAVGGRWDRADIEAGLDVHASLYRGSGWYSDGVERSFDHYSGWALHFYPLVWADMGGKDLCPPDLRETFARRLRRYLQDAIHFVGADGAPLLQGRSLIYRFAAAAPLWVGAAFGATDLAPGLTRRACSGMLSHFAAHGAPDEKGLLNLGLWHEWPQMAQSYSGFGSPYWAAKGYYGLVLPADHPVWTDEEIALPSERDDSLRAVEAPGWVVSSTRSDGIVRVVNHGTDHSVEGDARTDSPLYARLGYSTSTLPPLTGDALDAPVDNSVAVLDEAGRPSHRNGFTRLGVRVDGVVGIAISRQRCHWVDTRADASPDHGSGRTGIVVNGPILTVASVVRGDLEVRVVRVDALPEDHAIRSGGGGAADGDEGGTPGASVAGRLEVSGWPVHSDGEPLRCHGSIGSAQVSSSSLQSSVVGLLRLDDGGVTVVDGDSPLAEQVAVPRVRSSERLVPGQVHVALVRLAGAAAPPAGTPSVSVTDRGVDVTWWDGRRTGLELPPTGV